MPSCACSRHPCRGKEPRHCQSTRFQGRSDGAAWEWTRRGEGVRSTARVRSTSARRGGMMRDALGPGSDNGEMRLRLRLPPRARPFERRRRRQSYLLVMALDAAIIVSLGLAGVRHRASRGCAGTVTAHLAPGASSPARTTCSGCSLAASILASPTGAGCAPTPYV